MSTIMTIPPVVPPDGPTPAMPLFPDYGDHRIVFRGVSWETYESLSRARNKENRVRLAYDGRDLEIMTIGNLQRISGVCSF